MTNRISTGGVRICFVVSTVFFLACCIMQYTLFFRDWLLNSTTNQRDRYAVWPNPHLGNVGFWMILVRCLGQKLGATMEDLGLDGIPPALLGGVAGVVAAGIS